FCPTRPATIIKSDWRGEPRNTSAPNRAISKREAPVDIISMAQHARPKLIGQIEDLRAQFTAWSSLVKSNPSKPEDSFVSISCKPLQELLCHLWGAVSIAGTGVIWNGDPFEASVIPEKAGI